MIGYCSGGRQSFLAALQPRPRRRRSTATARSSSARPPEGFPLQVAPLIDRLAGPALPAARPVRRRGQVPLARARRRARSRADAARQGARVPHLRGRRATRSSPSTGRATGRRRRSTAGERIWRRSSAGTWQPEETCHVHLPDREDPRSTAAARAPRAGSRLTEATVYVDHPLHAPASTRSTSTSSTRLGALGPGRRRAHRGGGAGAGRGDPLRARGGPARAGLLRAGRADGALTERAITPGPRPGSERACRWYATRRRRRPAGPRSRGRAP